MGKGFTASIKDELALAVDRRRVQQAAIERGEGGATADPRLAREAELKRKQRERLTGKAAVSKKFGFSPRGTKISGGEKRTSVRRTSRCESGGARGKTYLYKV
jgi:hypothetical protein